MQVVIYLKIGENEQGQRLDRFLRKYMNSAPLSLIYKIIRKDIKVNGKRASEGLVLELGDEIALYVSDEDLKRYVKKPERKKAKRQFSVVFEDDNLLIVNKPFGLLTHGDSTEKKNHLANQVVDYLIETGSYNPRERTFTPAPANRLDRNTTGLVVFGKNADSLRAINRAFRNRENISKHYLALVYGEVSGDLFLSANAVKDRAKNIVKLSDEGDGLEMHTRVHPMVSKNGYSLLDVELLTGRTHQIRVQLSHEGFPILGDPKYGNAGINSEARKKLGLEGQLLHAWKLVFRTAGDKTLDYLDGLTVTAEPDARFGGAIKDCIGDFDLT